MVDFQIVIPAWCEASVLGETVASLKTLEDVLGGRIEILVVDDGSTDGTASLARALGVQVMSQPHAGKGAALRVGVAATSASVVIWCDADLPVPVEDLARLALVAARSEIAVFGRRDPMSALPRRIDRAFLGLTFRATWRLKARSRVRDPNCPAKAVPGDIARSIASACVSEGYAFDGEFVRRFELTGRPLTQIAVRWRDTREGIPIRTLGRFCAEYLAVLRLQAPHA